MNLYVFLNSLIYGLAHFSILSTTVNATHGFMVGVLIVVIPSTIGGWIGQLISRDRSDRIFRRSLLGAVHERKLIFAAVATGSLGVSWCLSELDERPDGYVEILARIFHQ